MSAFVRAPQPGASLLLAFSTQPHSQQQFNTLIILGPTRTNATRALAALEAGYQVLVGGSPASTWDAELAARRDQGEVQALEWSVGPDAGRAEWNTWFDSIPVEVTQRCMILVLGDTTAGSAHRRSRASAEAFAAVGHGRRFTVNVADYPHLSDFSWPTTHRFDLGPDPADDLPNARATAGAVSSARSPLQLALTTNSSGCRLASRLKREMVAALPSNVGAAVAAVGKLRRELAGQSADEFSAEEADAQPLNRAVEQLSRDKSRQLERWAAAMSGAGQDETANGWTAAEAQRTRMRYVAQISEYWPIDRLATVNLATLSAPTTPANSSPPGTPAAVDLNSPHQLAVGPPAAKASKGRIILLGTGTGSTLLLTRLAHLLLTSPPGSPYHVDLFLSDKLVPQEILALIPAGRRAGVVIARKYPGNAEHAQDELMRLAVEGAREGKTVLRMKQGDPFLYGRGGEEVLHFRAAGFEPVVVPGLSSCLAGPAMAGMPVTQRGVAESLVVCTGVGRGGKELTVAGYERSKTLCVLMGVARLDSLVETLLNHPTSSYPPHLPMALIERASSPDQRVIAATVGTIADVLSRLDAHRPPGMLIIGWGVMCLQGTNGAGDMTVLDGEPDEARDLARIRGWLGESGFRVVEGLGEGWKRIAEGES